MGGSDGTSTRGRSRRHVQLPDGRLLGYADWGDPDGAPVIYCHGGLSSRVDIAWASRLCAEHGFLRVPTLALFAGGRVVDQIFGPMSDQTRTGAIGEMIDQALL